MKPKPLRPGQSVAFRDDHGVAHPGILLGMNPRFARVESGDMELVVAVENLVLGQAA